MKEVPFDSLDGAFPILHLDEGEAILGIAVALDDQ